MALTSLQTIVDWATCKSEHPKWSENSVEDYMAKGEDINELFTLVNEGDFSPQFGSGSPEGLVAANYSLLYVDNDTTDFYFNPTFNALTGWSTNSSNYSPLSGSGSPEGIIASNYSLTYIDTDIPTSYFNPVFGADTGWVAL